MDLLATALVALLVKKSVDLLALAEDGDWRGVRKQVVAFAVGVGGALLVASSELAAGWQITTELTLADVGVASQVLAGLSVAAGGSVLHDFYSLSRTRADAAILSVPPPPPDA